MIYEIIGNSLLIFIIIIWSIHRGKKARQIINKWAVNKKYNIIKIRYKFFTPIHALFKLSKAQMYYDINVQDYNGKINTLILKVGNYWSGLLNEEIEIENN
jgi:hypothetical protein